MVERIKALFFTSILMLLVITFGIAQGAESFKPVPKITLSLSEAWQRQQVILTLEIPTPDEFARLEVEEFDLSDFEVIALPFERSEIKGVKNQYSVKIGWILFPLVAGQHEIELPQIIYRPNGGRKIKLKIPPQKLSVKSLPSYIPATMPIGEVVIKNTMPTTNVGKIHDTQTLINWNIELITKNVLPQTIPPILRQVKTSKALDVYPETLDRKVIKNYQGLQNNFLYKVPVKALKNGALALPTLSIQYFDPKDARLKRAKSEVLNHWAINQYLQWFFFTIITLLVLFSLFKLIQLTRRYFTERKKVKIVIQEISHTENIQEIRKALHKLPQAKGWGDNMTLQQVIKNWEAQKGEDSKLKECFQSLQIEQFSGTSSKSFENLKKELINSLKRA